MSPWTFALEIPLMTLAAGAKGALIALAALGAVVALRRASAASRHLVLALTVAALLLLPLLTVVVPSREIAVLPAASQGPATLAGLGEGLGEVPGLSVPSPENGSPRVRPAAPVAAAPVERRLPVAAVLSLLVLAVSVLLLARLLLAVRRLAGLTAGSVFAPPEWLRLLDEQRQRLGIAQTVRLGISSAVTVPVTFGWRRPVVLMPEAARGWEDEPLREALVHELAHVRRRDWPLQLAARFACALHWFNPLVWLLARRLRLEAELACDDQVLQAGAGAAGYAERLVALAREVRGATRPPAAVAAMARPSGLASRVTALLDPARRRGGPGRLAVTGAVAVALLLLALVAPARLVRAEAQETKYERDVRLGAERGIADGVREGAREALQDMRPEDWREAIVDGVQEGKQEALIEAAEHGDIEAVRFLLEKGADPDGAVLGDGSPLIAAAGKGSQEIVQLLLERGARPDGAVPGDGSPLIAAAEAGRADVVRQLLAAGATIDLVVPGDENPLIQAAANGRLEVVRILLDAGADPNIRVIADRSEANPDGDLRTPLRMARRRGHEAVVRLLLERGARE